MKILILTVQDTTQAKLILKPDFAIIKIPGNIEFNKQVELRDKLIKVADINKDTKQYLKLYYKLNTPYLFLNKKVSSTKKETLATYVYADL
ncbi:MAG TPA: hypothetical protein VIQ04_03840 [Nitrososphaeraceae archaeon]|jgi:hypothetical protein